MSLKVCFNVAKSKPQKSFITWNHNILHEPACSKYSAARCWPSASAAFRALNCEKEKLSVQSMFDPMIGGLSCFTECFNCRPCSWRKVLASVACRVSGASVANADVFTQKMGCHTMLSLSISMARTARVLFDTIITRMKKRNVWMSWTSRLHPASLAIRAVLCRM